MSFFKANIWMLVLLLAGCTPLYIKNLRYETFINEGSYKDAEAFIDDNPFFKKDRNELLYYLEKGKLSYLQYDYQESNEYFNRADLLIEDYLEDPVSVALSLFTNDEMKQYRAEDFEAVAVHYYKAINYISSGQYEDALVEARRINLRLQQLNDRYRQHKNRYADDAFAHILMGLVYESMGEFNNAFIAYRNAADLFITNDKPGAYFGVLMPEQLEKDLLRMAYLNGFYDELARYEKIFQTSYQHAPFPDGGELVFIWENGLGPVKGEWSINFSIVGDGADELFFVNEHFGLHIPVSVDNDDDRDRLGRLEFVRVAMPRYLERPPHFVYGELKNDGKVFPAELAEDYGTIARQTLKDRFLREAGVALARLALKKVAEHQIRKESEGLGTLINILNVATEKADTRNWQTLPAAIHYTRVPLKKGPNEITMDLQTCHNNYTEEIFSVEGNGGLNFLTYHTLLSEATVEPADDFWPFY